MQENGWRQPEVAGALRRAGDHHDRNRSFSVNRTQLILLTGTALLGVGLLVGPSGPFLLVGLIGAVAMGAALHQTKADTEPELDDHFDLRTGLPTASALSVTIADEQAMASLTGRLGAIVLEINGAAKRYQADDNRAADSLVASVLHRIQAHSWSYPIGGSFGPIVFLENPSTIIILRRDVLGDQSNHWLTERLLESINQPVSWAGTTISPEAIIGAAIGPVPDRQSVLALARLAKRDASQGGGGTVVVRHLERTRRQSDVTTEVVDASTGEVLGQMFAPVDLGSRVGIFEHIAGLRMAFGRSVDMMQDQDGLLLVRGSVTALSHPCAASDLIRRAAEAGREGRVGIVLTPDFPVIEEHRAVDTVRQLRQAGFTIVLDRRNPSDRVRPLPQCSLDVVLVSVDFDQVEPISPSERSMTAALKARHLRLAYSRPGRPMSDGKTPSVDDDDLHRVRLDRLDKSTRLIEGGHQAHLAKASAPGAR